MKACKYKQAAARDVLRCGLGITLALALLAGGGGCTTSAREGAGKGAAMGFVGGVAAGAVNNLLFGGNVLEGAVQGGVVGAAGGAAVGGVQGGMAAKQTEQASADAGIMTEKQIADLRKKQGDLNFQAMTYLVQCQHDDAIAMANRALAESKQTDRKVFALTLRAVAELETDRKDDAEATYAEVTGVDPKRNLDRVRADTFEAQLRVQSIRKANGLAPCK